MQHSNNLASFTSRRAAAGDLPAFSLPSHDTIAPRLAEDGSPDLSGTGTGSSQDSQAQTMSAQSNQAQGIQAPSSLQYTYNDSNLSNGGHVHGSWPQPPNSTYGVPAASPSQQHLGGQSPYAHRQSMYGQPPNMAYVNQRTPQSPANGGEGLPAPPYDQIQQPFQSPISGGGGGHGSHQSNISTATHAQVPSNTSAHVDPYAQGRSPHASSFYNAPSSAPQQSGYPSYAPQQSSAHHATPIHPRPGSRELSTLASHPPSSAMGPPAPYRAYQPYTAMHGMAHPVMSNMHQPGGQMSIIPGMGVPMYGGHQMMYGHPPPPSPVDRPFKCEQCTQSFSRNHDLKRHKRIHLAVKPFPCSYCAKSFSRKDALKRHRLVKGCEHKSQLADGDGVKHGDSAIDEANGQHPKVQRI